MKINASVYEKNCLERSAIIYKNNTNVTLTLGCVDDGFIAVPSSIVSHIV